MQGRKIIILGASLVLAAVVYYFLAGNLTVTSEDGIVRDGIGRVIVHSMLRDWFDKAVIIGIAVIGFWTISKGVDRA